MSKSFVLVALDVETTGKNPAADQIIEFSAIRIELEGPGVPAGLDAAQRYHRRFRPTVPVSPGAERVHGISDADLAHEPPFADHLEEIRALVERADVILGYNVGFDLRFLESEFERCEARLSLEGKSIVDPLRIWHTMEPRRLENAYERFVGGQLLQAHSAEADTQAVVEVLAGMRSAFGLDTTTWEDLALMTAPDRALWVGGTHHLRWEAGDVVIGFGKYDGRPLFDVAASDADYLRWIRESNFPAHVQNLCKGALSGISREEFLERTARHFGQPVETESAD